jgi:hypothetical protein
MKKTTKPVLPTLNKNDILEDWYGMKLVRISSTKGLAEWLYGQTIPLVEDNETPYDWCYYSDWERFVRQFPIID